METLDNRGKLLVDIPSVLPDEVKEWQTVSGFIPVDFPTEFTVSRLMTHQLPPQRIYHTGEYDPELCTV